MCTTSSWSSRQEVSGARLGLLLEASEDQGQATTVEALARAGAGGCSAEIEQDLAQEFPEGGEEEDYAPTTPEEEAPEELRKDPTDPMAVVAPSAAVIFPYPYPSGLPPASSLVSR